MNKNEFNMEILRKISLIKRPGLKDFEISKASTHEHRNGLSSIIVVGKYSDGIKRATGNESNLFIIISGEEYLSELRSYKINKIINL
jgi:hypothetical protein